MDKLDLIYDLVKKQDDKLDQMNNKLVTIQLDVERNTNDVEVHIKRTETAEKRLEHIEKRFTFTWVFKLITGALGFFSLVTGTIAKFMGLF